ncbi:MAG: tail fiber domain-containing protein, partial [Bacteroidota bacterium]
MKLSFLLMVGALCSLLTLPAWGQTGVGTPSQTLQFSTNSAASNGVAPLAHAQVAPFGSITGNATWASIGRSPFAPPGASGSAVPYGIRIQKEGNFALFNLLERSIFGTTSEDLIIGYGTSTRNTVKIRHISNQFTNTFRDVATFGSRSVSFNTNERLAFQVSNQTVSGFGSGSAIRGFNRVVGIPSFGSSSGVVGDVSNTTGQGTDYGGRFGVSFSNAPTRAAGFFSGDLVYTGSLQGPSDRKLKRNIKAETGHLDKLMKLNTYTYQYKTDEFAYMALPSEIQHGLIAQELEEVYPELVKEYDAPIMTLQKDGEIKDEGLMRYKSVNYTSLIPVLIGAVKELGEKTNTIEDLQAEITALKTEVANLKGTEVQSEAPATSWSTLGEAELFQNTPNPFTEQTTIRYNLPQFRSSVA